MNGARHHPAWWAFLVHRVSGLALALFLPAHFLVMGLALGGEAPLDGFLRGREQPLVIAGEWVLVMLLAAHLTGGVRLLMLELLPWREWQKALAATAGGLAVAAGFLFLLAR